MSEAMVNGPRFVSITRTFNQLFRLIVMCFVGSNTNFFGDLHYDINYYSLRHTSNGFHIIFQQLSKERSKYSNR